MPNLIPTLTAGQLTAENRSVDVGGESFAYRRFGDRGTTALPLLLLQRFRGNLDAWDPALTDRLAEEREVILVDNRGVGGSTGATPDDVTTMARDVLAFVDAMGLVEVDVLGFSLGGHVAQALALLRPRLVRRLVLAGTAPRGAPGLHRWADAVYPVAMPDQPTLDDALALFFAPSDDSRGKGIEFLARSNSRTDDLDEPTDLATRDSQLTALTAWGIPDPSKLSRLAAITQPAFVANGDNDTMMQTSNSALLADHLPDARLRIYADAGHGFLYQCPELFAEHVSDFLTDTKS